MSAIMGLVEALEGKQAAGDYLMRDDLQGATNAALAQAKERGEFDGAPGQDGDSGPAGADGVSPTASGDSYTLPIAGHRQLGGVQPAAKNDAMT